MTFYRIRTPLTAFALCALMTGGMWAMPYPAMAQDAAAQDVVVQQDAAASLPALPLDNVEAVPVDDHTAAKQSDESAADEKQTAEKESGEKADNKTATTDEDTRRNPSHIKPTFPQLQAVALDKVGRGEALQNDAQDQDGSRADYVEPAGDTHPPLHLTPDKSEIIRLDFPASAVLVGNEAHVNIMIDTPTTLVAVPRQPGASYFTVLDEQRRVIMRRHVIVGPAAQYVRVRRSCGTSDRNCNHTSVFYCPDGMCHPVHTMQRPGTAPAQQRGAAIGARGMMGDSQDSAFGNEGGDTNYGAPATPFNFVPIPVPFPMDSGDE